MVEGNKQLRVDNWGIFFLQRLQVFFSKTDYCDLTLQFDGNVQLKVHRLVMNACTEYFTFLEQTCPVMEEGTIMMPPDLQPEVIVPIVNFMYTGMLEFRMSSFEKLYKAAEIMNISVLTKLLDAQRKPPQVNKPAQKRKLDDVISTALTVKQVSKTPTALDFPTALPGRKLPIWKRKTAPMSSQSDYHEKWSLDSPMAHDSAPKPTRFEWPDEELPSFPLMDSTFEEISYTSKPLLTQEEETRVISNAASTSNLLEDTRQASPSHSKKITKTIVENVKEQKIKNKSETSSYEEIILFGGEEYADISQKRRADPSDSKMISKKSKNGDKENNETNINVKANSSDLDHTKIVSEILKKYPNLVKKNKNIKIKIMPVSPSPTKKTTIEKPIPGFNEIKRKGFRADSSTTAVKQRVASPPKLRKKKEKPNFDGPWVCDKCDGMRVEFVLYYLYRKHMTDIHEEVFDIRLCKYCGQKCSKPNLMMYHLYTKHGLKPPAIYIFPKCDQCPYIALSDTKLLLHKQRHQASEMQCTECKLAFSNQATLTTHLQITDHHNRTGKSSFDCQYCTKKLQSSINLFSHIKNTHFKESQRDGIVGLDELDETDEDDDNENEEEYLVPEMFNESEVQKDKISIISNVKLESRQGQVAPHNQQELVPLVQTTEGDPLNNVTGSITTSLGLVDIVVLDENQQYILQQENQEQAEFILPDLSTAESHFGAQVITTQHSNVIPQGVLQTSGTDITSTDELVMVLTDHDYQEEQEGEHADNSNIVVLYSHPVDGQQGQFITSQGNLLVNSQTGMLELRNGATITTASNQIVVNSSQVEPPIESIEMIQREIESHQELKSGRFYEEQKSTDALNQRHSKQTDNEHVLQELEDEQIIINNFGDCHQSEFIQSGSKEVIIQDKVLEENQEPEKNPEIYLSQVEPEEAHVEPVAASQVQQESLQESVEHVENEYTDQLEVTSSKQIETDTGISTVKDADQDVTNRDLEEGTKDEQDCSRENAEEPMEIEETQPTELLPPDDNSRISKVVPMEECEETNVPQEQESITTEDEHITAEEDGVDVPPERIDVPKEPQDQEVLEPSVEDEVKEVGQPTIELEQKAETTSSNDYVDEPVGEEMEVDGEFTSKTAELNNELATESQGTTETLDCAEIREFPNAPEDEESKQVQSESQELTDNSTSEQAANDEEEEDSRFTEKEDESSQSFEAEKPQNSSTTKTNSNINREILEDWEEDTDSQQSEKANSTKDNDNDNQEKSESDSCKDGERQAAVDKLMNDWEDEDEEEKRDQ